MKLTKEQLAILQHSLGLDQYGRGPQYRNHFVTDPESDDGQVCESLVEAELMTRTDGSQLSGGMPIYRVTADGIEEVYRQSPKPPKVSRSTARYSRWLESGADDCGISFGQWLKERMYSR